MNYYCLYIRTGLEEQFKKEAAKVLKQKNIPCQFYFFTTKLYVGAAKYNNIENKPLFPGYVFISVSDLTPQIIEELKKINGFIHALNSNSDVEALNGQDMNTLKMLLHTGEHHEMSLAQYDVNDRVKIISGDLKDMEGCILRIHRRNQRATVQIKMFSSQIKFDLSYKILEKLPPEEADADAVSGAGKMSVEEMRNGEKESKIC